MKQIERICLCNSAHSLLQYFLLSSTEQILHTYYFGGSAVDKILGRYFPEQYVNVFDFCEKYLRERPKENSLAEWEARLYNEVFPQKWPFLLETGIKYYGHDHLYATPYVFRENTFELLEDGLLNYFPYPYNTYVEDEKETSALGPLFGIIRRYAGDEPQCVKIHLTGLREIPYNDILPVEVNSLENLWNLSNEGKKEMINAIFGMYGEDYKKYVRCTKILMTQPLSEDKIISESEKEVIYKDIVANIGAENLLIKPHPREKTNYEKIFPHIAVVGSSIPVQLLSLNGVRFKTAIAISSTALFDFPYKIEVVWIGGEIHPKILLYAPHTRSDKVMITNSNIVRVSYTNYTNKKISVIVPIYKVEKYLDACVESIISQTYNNLEIILVDDGSPDECPRLCEKWSKKDSRIIVIHQKNGGLSAARNAGMNRATGDFIGFVDSDDTIEPDMYEQLLQSMLREPRADFAVCGVKTIVEGSADTISAEEYNNYFKVDECQNVSIGTAAINRIPAPAWNKLYRRDFLVKNGIRFPQGMNNEDEAFFLFCVARSRYIAFVPMQLYHYYRRDVGIIVEQQERFAKKGILPDYLSKIAPLLVDFIKRDRRYDLLGRVLMSLLSYVNTQNTDLVQSCVAALLNRLDVNLKQYSCLMGISSTDAEALENLRHGPYDENMLMDSDESLFPYPLPHMNNGPQISIIVPVYNVEKYLLQCLESLIRQTYDRIEIIVVNDGSTDNSLDIMEECARTDGRIHVINQKNRGTAIARQVGLNKSKGQYVIFVDPDDWIEPDTCSKLLERIIETGDDIVLHAMVAEVDGEESLDRIQEISNYFNREIPKIEGPQKMLQACFVDRLFNWSMCMRIFSREVLVQAFEHLPQKHCIFGEDMISTFYILSYSRRMSYFHEPLYHYRIGTGVSTKKSLSREDVVQSLQCFLYLNDCREFARKHYKDNGRVNDVLDKIEALLADGVVGMTERMLNIKKILDECSELRNRNELLQTEIQRLLEKRKKHIFLIRLLVYICVSFIIFIGLYIVMLLL